MLPSPPLLLLLLLFLPLLLLLLLLLQLPQLLEALPAPRCFLTMGSAGDTGCRYVSTAKASAVMLARHRPLQAAGRMSWYSGMPKSM
jgi:hypothetical protein